MTTETQDPKQIQQEVVRRDQICVTRTQYENGEVGFSIEFLKSHKELPDLNSESHNYMLDVFKSFCDKWKAETFSVNKVG